LGAVNVHASLLPRHRGAAPVSAAVLAGDAETGVTIQRVVKKLDAGPMLASRRIAIREEDDAGSLTARLAETGAELLLEVLDAFARGVPPPEQPQDESQATYAGRLRRDAGVIRWGEAADAVWRHVRAMTPRPGARTALLREPPLALTIRRCRPAEGKGEPGTVVSVGDDAFFVAAGSGLLEVQEVVPAGRKPMSAREFRNGYRIAPGERLGPPPE
jgi:methionyl-tRNA formyltransferase